MAATRDPIKVLLQTLTTSASGGAYTVPAGSRLTISAATAANTTAGVVTLSCQVTPSGGSALPIISAINIPASGSTPTTLPAIVGQTLGAGDKIELWASAGASINVWVSAYLQA